MAKDRQDIGVLCVEDNKEVAEALRIKLDRTAGIEWKGWLPHAGDLAETARQRCPSIVVIDVDMPGKDPFLAVVELIERCPDTRVIVFSGHVRKDLLDSAIEAGVWGYVAKSDGEEVLVSTIFRVAAGEYVLSPTVRAVTAG